MSEVSARSFIWRGALVRIEVGSRSLLRFRAPSAPSRTGVTMARTLQVRMAPSSGKVIMLTAPICVHSAPPRTKQFPCPSFPFTAAHKACRTPTARTKPAISSKSNYTLCLLRSLEPFFAPPLDSIRSRPCLECVKPNILTGLGSIFSPNSVTLSKCDNVDTRLMEKLLG